MSKLIVEICKIDKIETLEKADKLEMATIKGWQCLVGKGQHKEGELIIFVPPDSVVPPEQAERLKLDFLKENGRVRTIKLRGYISQGLVLPLSILPANRDNRLEGDDVAIELGITKYEVERKAAGEQKKETIAEHWAKYRAKEITLRRFVAKTVDILHRRFSPIKLTNPRFKAYTDINNVKHYPAEFEEGELVILTEKIHGTNFRAGTVLKDQSFLDKLLKKENYEFVYGSHHVQKTVLSGKGWYGEDVYGRIAKKYELKEILPPGYTIFGEIYGPKIQELTYGVDEIDCVFFDLKKDGEYVGLGDFLRFCIDRNLPMAPCVYCGPYFKELLKHETDGKTILGKGAHIREGVVLKSHVERYSNRCGRRILKSISADYLLTKKSEKPEEFVDDNAEFSH